MDLMSTELEPKLICLATISCPFKLNSCPVVFKKNKKKNKSYEFQNRDKLYSFKLLKVPLDIYGKKMNERNMF
jgi:hypothetical protein